MSALFLLLGCTMAVAQVRASEPSFRTIRTLQQQHSLKQRKIAHCSALSRGLSVAGKEFRYADGDLTIRGTDKRGGRYSILNGAGVGGCSVWSASFADSASPVLEILTPGQNSSGGYDTRLTVILFDHEGRPFPWQATGKFTTASGHGIDQVITEGAAENASIIVPTKEGTSGADANYAFQLYRFSSSEITKVQGNFLGAKWPMLVNATPALIKHIEAASLTADLNATLADPQTISSSNTKITGSEPLLLSNGLKMMPPLLLIEDSAEGNRFIELEPTPKDIARLVQKKALVRAVGTSCEEEKCRPMVLIAKLP